LKRQGHRIAMRLGFARWVATKTVQEYLDVIDGRRNSLRYPRANSIDWGEMRLLPTTEVAGQGAKE
jgi:hypothetical protein